MVWIDDNYRSDAWRDSYDAWKLASPYDEWPYVEEEEERPCVCGDSGWLDYDDEHVIPCTECSAEVTLEDFDELYCGDPLTTGDDHA